MPNLRVIYDNAADRATLSASSSVGALVAANLKSDLKSVVWRSDTAGAGATPLASLTLTWATPEIIAGVALPYCNLSSQATLRVYGYTNAADSVPLFDTGAVLACPNAGFGLWNWGAVPLGANAYAYGGGALGRVWVPVPGAVRKLIIELSDPGNPGGYIEASRLVCGAYWEPAKNVDYGASAQPLDHSKNFRNDAGDLMSDQGARSVKLALPMSKLDPTDRARLFSILRGNGITRPVFVSVFPNDTDTAREQDHQLYGKLVTTPSMTLPSFNLAAATLEIESI
jgi:hypothetical protein